jgi:hypothetical protein
VVGTGPPFSSSSKNNVWILYVPLPWWRWEVICCLELGPDYSCSGLWLVRLWTGPRAPIQAEQVTRATGSCGSDCCRCMKGILVIFWRIKLALVIKNLVFASYRNVLRSSLRITELQCEQPLQVNNSANSPGTTLKEAGSQVATK